MRFARISGAVIGGVALALSLPLSASAEEPVDLDGAYVVDSAGVLGSRIADVEDALDELYDRAQAQIFVVLVDSFDDPSDPGAWSDETAGVNGLGSSDVLLAISIDDRIYQWSVDEGFELGLEELEAVAEDRLVPELRDDDWAGGLVAVADGVGDRITGEGGFPVLPVLGGAAALGVAGFAVSRLVKRRRAASAAEADQRELDRRAGALLVALDDALEANRQELGFAEAQFGVEQTADFRAAIDDAERQAKEAFAIRQRLDDAEPETPEERARSTEEIIRLCEAADATLDAQTEAFEQLRRLEARAPEVLESVAAEHGALPARIDAAEGTVADLRARFGAAGVAAVADNPAQARKLHGFAAESIARARTELGARRSSRAAIEVRGAQQAIGQAARLVETIERLAIELPEIAGRLSAAVADTKSDLAEARTALESGPEVPKDALRAAVADADAALGAVGGSEPAAALSAVEAANAALESTLTAFRDQQTQVARAAAQLGRVTAEAQSSVSAARDFIATRRGAIGASARTRINEAERELASAIALGAADPVAALRAARRAESLGSAALELARAEVDRSRSSRLWADDDSGGAALGGILDGLFSSGSSSGWSGGWSSGGSSSRPRRSSGGIRRSSGGRSSRSSRSSGRRSGGGRF